MSNNDQNESYLSKIKKFEDAALFSFLLIKAKELLKQIKGTPYLILYFTLSLIYSVILTILALGTLHYIVYNLDITSYSISSTSIYQFYILGLNSLLSIDSTIIVPRSETANLLITLGGLLKWLLSLIYGVFLFNILKSHYNFTLDKILDKFALEEDKISFLLKEKYDKDLASAVKEIEYSFDPNSQMNFKSTKMTEAKLLIRDEAYDQALNILNALDDKTKNDSEVYYLLGYLYAEKGDYIKMHEFFTKSLAIDSQPKNNIETSIKYWWSINHNKGVILYNEAKKVETKEEKNKLFTQSYDCFMIANDIYPNTQETIENLVYVNIELKKYRESSNLLIRLVEKYSNEKYYERLIELLYELNEIILTKKYINEGLKKFPQNKKIQEYFKKIEKKDSK